MHEFFFVTGDVASLSFAEKIAKAMHVDVRFSGHVLVFKTDRATYEAVMDAAERLPIDVEILQVGALLTCGEPRSEAVS